LLPNATKQILPDIGHMLTVEALDEVVGAIEAFVSAPSDRVEARA
jgi:pimeloyl-ACP methyl ester carboxylesterase